MSNTAARLRLAPKKRAEYEQTIKATQCALNWLELAAESLKNNPARELKGPLVDKLNELASECIEIATILAILQRQTKKERNNE